MAKQYDNNMSGAAFKNERKTKDSQPGYTGQCEIDGKEYWLSVWIKTPRKGGDKYFSIAFTEKEAASQDLDDMDDSPGKKVIKDNFDNFGDDIPF